MFVEQCQVQSSSIGKIGMVFWDMNEYVIYEWMLQ
jgi:hypothetical protein